MLEDRRKRFQSCKRIWCNKQVLGAPLSERLSPRQGASEATGEGTGTRSGMDLDRREKSLPPEGSRTTTRQLLAICAVLLFNFLCCVFQSLCYNRFHSFWLNNVWYYNKMQMEINYESSHNYANYYVFITLFLTLHIIKSNLFEKLCKLTCYLN
jgi:hypothetical protein